MRLQNSFKTLLLHLVKYLGPFVIYPVTKLPKGTANRKATIQYDFAVPYLMMESTVCSDTFCL